MSKEININFQALSDKIDVLTDIVEKREMVDDYPTNALLDMVEIDFDQVLTTLSALPDIDIHGGM
jgi:hypothetical protein